MEGYFRVDRGSCTTRQESRETIPVTELHPQETAWKFVSQMEQVLGEGSEPDPLFFVESWTLGIPAATENFQRRQEQKSRERHAAYETDSLSPLSFVQQNTEFSSSDCIAAIEDRYVSGWQRHATERPAAQDRVSQAAECDNWQEALRPMTLQGACRLLRVAATSTREQIRAAYRQMASRYHPDRLGRRTEKERQVATERMTAINEAYRLLCSGLFKESV